MIAALYVQKDGCYAGLAGVDCWDAARDAPPVDWFCHQCKVSVPLKQRCRHCGKTETEEA